MRISIDNETIEDIFSKAGILYVVYILLINNMKNSILSLLAIAFSMIFILKPIYILPGLLISSLLGEYFVAFNGIGISRILVLVFIGGSLFNCINEKRKFNLSHVILLLALCMFNMISSITSLTGILEPSMTMALNLVLLFFMYYTITDDIHMFMKTMIICMITLSLYIMYTIMFGNAATVIDGSNLRIVLDEAINANSLGMALAQLVSFFFGLIVVGKNKTINGIFCIMNLVNLLLTGSRSATLAAIISIIFVIPLISEKTYEKYFNVIIILLLLGAVYLVMETYGMDIMNRFSLASIEENGGSGRTVIWEALLVNVIPAHLFFGVGFGGINIYNAISPYVTVAHGAHNIVISILTSTGIVGLVIYFTFFIKSLYSFIKSLKKIKIIVIPLTMVLTALVNGMGEDIYNNRFLWFSIGLGFMFIYNKALFNTKEEMEWIL